jgi:Fe2+ transport system protein FeoA
MSLATCPPGREQRIVRVLDQEPEFLQFLERQGLMPGATVTVDQRETAADVVQFRTARPEAASLGLAAAAKILVETAPGGKERATGRKSRR